MRIPRRPVGAFCLSTLSLSSSHAEGLSSSASRSRAINFAPCPNSLFFCSIPNLSRRVLVSGYSCSVSKRSLEEVDMGERRPAFNPNGSSAVDQDGSIWASAKWGQEIPIGNQIFCNRSLNMKNIVAVGFDMDYTLAQYMPETFESLAYNGTLRKLVFDLGYPSELLEWKFDWKYMVRGLVLDKKRGNILKMDRHKYVKVAYHGFKELSKEDKVAAYGNTLIRDSFDEPDYALIDTLFSLAETFLFAQLVDFRDNHSEKFSSVTDYSKMYRDVRAAVDLCHRDGTLKQMVAKDPGRKLFLVGCAKGEILQDFPRRKGDGECFSTGN